jgi:hypothetical protein
MAKNRKDLAESLLADDSGGWLTSFLADEDEFDRRSLWRLGSWGIGSVGAVIIAILANQSGTGLRHEQVAAADLVKQSQQLQSAARARENETRRLASAVDTLNSDRDRLYTRVTVLEQGLDSVTGSINRKSAAQDEPPKAAWGLPQAAALLYPPSVNAPGSLPPAAPAAPQASLPSPNPVTANAAASTAIQPDASKKPGPSESRAPSLPVVAPVASAAPTAVVETVAAKSSLAKSSLAMPAPVQSASVNSSPVNLSPVNLSPEASSPETLPPAMVVTPAKPEIASTPATTPPDSFATKPDEPNDVATAAPAKSNAQKKAEAKIVVAAIPAAVDVEPTTRSLPSDIPVAHTEFGVDLGSARSINGLRALWRGILKSDAREVASLRPIIVLKERTNGLGMQLRLVAGPLTDAAAAAKICAVLSENDRNCETSVFDGQRLSMQEDAKDSVAAKRSKATHTSSHHRRSRRTVRVEEPVPMPPPPPAPPPSKPSTISSFFSR